MTIYILTLEDGFRSIYSTAELAYQGFKNTYPKDDYFLEELEDSYKAYCKGEQDYFGAEGFGLVEPDEVLTEPKGVFE